MKIFRRICIFALLLAVLLSQFVPATAQPDELLSLTQGCVGLDARVSLKNGEQLLPTAQGVILYEMNTHTLVYSWKPDEKIDPSGMNKLMTALLAIETGNLDEKITVTATALSTLEPGAVSAGLKKDEQLTLRDLLYCMMVGSANDAAAVIAEHLAGDQASFVKKMNDRARELGCVNTQFLNPTGLSLEGQYSTPRDLAKITAAALEEPVFAELFSAVGYTVPKTELSEERQIRTTNYLMSRDVVKNQYDARVTGGKTGALSTRDRSVICTAESDGNRYLAVVMSARSTLTANGLSVVTFGSFEEARALLDHGIDGYVPRRLLTDDFVLTRFPVNGGENDVAVRASDSVTVMIPTDMAEVDVRYVYNPPSEGIAAPVALGQTVGSVEVWFRSVCVGQCDLIAMYDVDEPGENNVALTPVGHSASEFPWKLIALICLLVVLVCLLIAGVVLTVARWVRILKAKRRHRKPKGSRRRRR